MNAGMKRGPRIKTVVDLDRVVYLRETLGLSLRTIAARFGVHVSTVAWWLKRAKCGREATTC